MPAPMSSALALGLTEMPVRPVSSFTPCASRKPFGGNPPGVDIASLVRGERAASVDDCHLADQKIFAGGQWHDGAIIDRLRLPAGDVVNGPCLLVQPDATIYIDPGLAARVDDLGNIIIKEQE